MLVAAKNFAFPHSKPILYLTSLARNLSCMLIHWNPLYTWTFNLRVGTFTKPTILLDNTLIDLMWNGYNKHSFLFTNLLVRISSYLWMLLGSLRVWTYESWFELVDWVTNQRRVDDEPRERQVIHLLELVINHNWSTHAQNLGIMEDIVPLWMNNYNKFLQSLCLWMRGRLWMLRVDPKSMTFQAFFGLPFVFLCLESVGRWALGCS